MEISAGFAKTRSQQNYEHQKSKKTSPELEAEILTHKLPIGL
jgi:hypothetical protein